MSCRATRLLLEAAELRGLDPAAVVEGLPLSYEELRDVRRRIPWSEFVEFIDRLERAVGGAAGLEALGEATMQAPSYGFFRTAARQVLTPRRLNELGARFVAPTLFPDLPFEILESTDRGMVLRVVLPPSWRNCPGFFHICAGALGAITTLLGLPRTNTELSLGNRYAVLELTYPQTPRSLGTAFRRARAWLAGVPVHELWEQQDAVHESYQAMLRSRQEFRDLLDSAPIGAAIHRDGKYLWVNAALAQMAGWNDPAEFVGRSLLDDVHPDDRARVIARLSKPTSASERGEYRILRRDGSVSTWEFAATQNVMFMGAPARLMLGNDITERVRAREQLALNERMASLGMLAAGVAHEINNPLTYVQLNVQAIAREAERTDASRDLREAAATALEGLERVRAIVADLRTFARSDEDTIGPVDVNDIIKTTLRLAERTIAGTSKIEVSFGEVPTVSGNRGRLGQVILNLLVNAHEAIEERGLPGVIRVRSSREPSGHVVIEIADNGVGIPSDVLSRVFEPFFTTKPVRRGTGLGLAICHRIVSGYEGGITIESSPAVGSDPGLRTFVRIRLQPADGASGSTPPGAVHSAVLARKRILVVDDEPAVGRAIDASLGQLHDVVVVNDGRAALELLHADPAFDVVLCDVMMPGFDGIELFEEVARTLPALAHRFVFMSGGAFTPRSRAFLATSRNQRIEKPFNVVQLAAAIEHAAKRPA